MPNIRVQCRWCAWLDDVFTLAILPPVRQINR
uniref:NADH-cytochrome b5 reductase n=1 Tax=Rhizophora mucronata TaxID=61149 RepID=A0A2P2JGY0_RHIMU